MAAKANDGAEARINDAMQRQQFLSDASRILGESIDYGATLQSVARLAVPAIADWCVIDLIQNDGSVARVAIEHKDQSRRQEAAAFKEHYPPITNAPTGPGRVLKTCRTDYQRHVPQAFIDAAATDPDRLALLRRLGLHAYISTPLIARSRLLGAITVFTEGGRAFGAEDVTTVEELARRSAIAIDNARLYEEAQRAVQARDEMLAIVSHDLRTPLSAIMMASSIQLASVPSTPAGRELRKTAETCQRAAQHMCRLINDLTDISHIESGRLTVQPTEQNPQALLREVVDALRPVANEQGTDLRHDAGSVANPATVECDRDRIVQVLSNLVVNAIKVCATSITLSAEARGEDVVFAVHDNGPGVPQEDLPHLFDRYWRGRNAKYKGTGLGLPIAKGIIDAHGGYCQVTSEVGRGTTFTFVLPRRI